MSLRRRGGAVPVTVSVSAAITVTVALALLVLLTLPRADAVSSVRSSSGNSRSKLNSNSTNGTAAASVKRFHLFVFDFERVGSLFSVGVFMLIVAISRMLFHLHHKLPSYVPESCLLIVLGVIAGVFVYFVGGRAIHLDPDTFFLLLLPPIVFDAGFFMNTRALFDNMGTVALFAGIGTAFNTLAIGFSLHFFSQNMLGIIQIDISILEALLFSSLIAAVDPVAVLSLFEEIHVNEELYIIVFGESLFNDAVSVVFFNMFYKLNEIQMSAPIIASDYIYAAISMFTVGFFGSMVGVLMGLAVAFVTRFTDHIRVLEPVYAFLMTYIAYLMAEMFHWSGILAAVFCGMVMKQYVPANMSRKSYTTVKYFLKMASSMCESIVFMYMGLTTVNDSHQFSMVNFSFIGFTLLFCLIYRTIGVIMLTSVANMFRIVRLSFVDQFVMSYGGLRGAVAISLAMLVNGDIVPHRDLFTTCAIAVVYFTVFVQGFTIKPLVTWLNVKRDDKRETSMNAELHLRVIDHAMVGIEDIIGVKGHNRLRHLLDQFNYRYLQRILLREQPQTRESDLIHVISKLNIKHAVEYIEQHGSLDAYGSNMHMNHSSPNLQMFRNSSVGQLDPSNRLALPTSDSGTATPRLPKTSADGEEGEDPGIVFNAGPPATRRKQPVPKISIDGTATGAASKWRQLADASRVPRVSTDNQESEDCQTQSARLNWQRLRTAAKFKVIIAQTEHEKISPTNSLATRRQSAGRTDSNSSNDSARILRNTLKVKPQQLPFINARSHQLVDQDDESNPQTRSSFLQAVTELQKLSTRTRTSSGGNKPLPPIPTSRPSQPKQWARLRRGSERDEQIAQHSPKSTNPQLSHSLERLPESVESETEHSPRQKLSPSEEAPAVNTKSLLTKPEVASAARETESAKSYKSGKARSMDDTESDIFYSCMSVTSSTFNDPNALSSTQLRTPPTASRGSSQSDVSITAPSRPGKIKPSDMATLVEIETDESDVASNDTADLATQHGSSQNAPKPFRRDYIPPCDLVKGDHETLL